MKIFIAGTDTNIGKTYVSSLLLRALSLRGYSTIGIKPLATGGYWQGGQLYNADALTLLSSASIKLDYAKINPLIFEPAIAPHLAAQQQRQTLTAVSLLDACQDAWNHPADMCLVEGVGGWNTPLNDRETMADFVKISQCKVILVVGMRLGCLNHALLTQGAIQQMQIPALGWIANCMDPHMDFLKENIDSLRRCLNIPFLGEIPYSYKTPDIYAG